MRTGRNRLALRALLAALALFLPLFSLATSADPAPHPTIAIIIDDVGNTRAEARRLIQIEAPLTLSFLPFLPFTRELAHEAHQAGKEIMLHIPMQNMRGAALGPGGLTLGMERPLFTAALRGAIASIPHLSGINNHMGSALTQRREPMQWTMEELREHPLYFVDSRTTALTVAQQVAQDYRIPNLARDVFLDHEISDAAVDREFKRLLKLARERGTAVAIGHPHRVTIEYLERELPKLGAQGYAVATVSALWMIRHQGMAMFPDRPQAPKAGESRLTATAEPATYAPTAPLPVGRDVQRSLTAHK